ncbi:HTH domain-containing protein [Lacticaseibacillus thailandensis]|uniref:HTH domain-containing protein n=1 Tax=Lacticaseibacillus thailandensis TaxID=381741 RepID=UPI000B069D48|nr:HTH domain-containing protein [Lacticaseibacillus thailandensis]
MNKTDRRTFIQGLISNASAPISATQIARRLNVSRQTIVATSPYYAHGVKTSSPPPRVTNTTTLTRTRR